MCLEIVVLIDGHLACVSSPTHDVFVWAACLVHGPLCDTGFGPSQSRPWTPNPLQVFRWNLVHMAQIFDGPWTKFFFRSAPIWASGPNSFSGALHCAALRSEGGGAV